MKGIHDLLRKNYYNYFFQADFYFFQETHAVMSDFAFWKNQWGSDKRLVYGVIIQQRLHL